MSDTQAAPSGTRVYEVTAPDGRRFIVTAPPGASQDDVIRYARADALPAASQPGERSGRTIEVEAPGGIIVEFPEGTPRDVMEEALRRRFPPPGQASSAPAISQLPPLPPGFELEGEGQTQDLPPLPPGYVIEDGPWRRFQTPVPAPVPSTMGAAANLAGQFGAGANQGIASLVGGPFDLVNSGLRAIGVPIPQGSVTGAVQRGINSLVGEPTAPQGTVEDLARGAGRGLVDAASVMVPAAGVSRMAQAAGATPTLLGRSAGALASQPGLQVASGMVGGAVGQATDSPLAGAAAAFATPMAAGGVGRAITPIRMSPNPGRDALVRAAEAEGIPLTAGQATGNRFLQNVEAQLEQLPLTAGPQRAIREEQNRAFIGAAMRRAGETATDTSPATINAARDRIGGTIGTIANRNTLEVTPRLTGTLQQIDDSLRFLPAEAAGPVRARIDQLRGMVVPGTPGGVPDTIPGASYRLMDSQLGRSMRSTSNGDLRAALGELRTTLRDAMDQSISPQDAAAWAQARREYANLMTIANAAGRAGAGAAEGQMSPVALRQALDQSTGRGYAFGRGDLNELARVGQSLLRTPPDSGTAGRTMAQNLLTGSAMTGGGIAGTMAGGPLGGIAGAGASLVMPRIAQMLMNSGAGQQYLRNRVVQNPVMTRELAAALLGQEVPRAGFADRSVPAR